jgi:hypothetical protein
MRENIIDLVMEMEFNVNIYSQVFYSVSPGYRGLTKFIVVDQYVRFPGKRYNLSFTDVEFHRVSNAPTLYRVNVRLKKMAVLRRINGSVNADVVSKE